MERKIITFVAFILIVIDSSAQTFIQKGTTHTTTKVTINYYENIDANRPSIDIEFTDGFKAFELIVPVCPGEFAWCIRNQNNDDIAYLKAEISQNEMLVDVEFEAALFSELSKQDVYQIMLLRGTYTRLLK